MGPWKIDQKIIWLIYSHYHGPKYFDPYHQLLNGAPPSNVYRLNFQYNNIHNCIICVDEFCPITPGTETILHCGHRYYTHCSFRWQDEQFCCNFQHKQWCPICHQQYNWKQRYYYIYAIS